MIIEYARYGSLKDFLKKCEEVVLQLNHVPQVLCYRSHQHSSSSSHSSCSTCSAYPKLTDKTPLCAHNGVFSPDNTPAPLDKDSAAAGMFEFPPSKLGNLTRERLATQDSGFFGDNVDTPPQAAYIEVLDGGPTTHSVVPLTHDYINSKGLLYMEDIQNFALQIASGLKHLEDIQVGPVRCS